MKTERADWYDTPLYYDIIFDADTAKEADFLEAVMSRHGDSPSQRGMRMLEPACGSGRLVAEMVRRGHTVSGFDLNQKMRDYAQQRLAAAKLSATLWQDRMEDFDVKGRAGFDFAHCLVSTFKYVLDEDGAASHLQRVAGSLREGGLYVLGLHLTDYSVQRIEHERWAVKRGGISVVCNTRTWPADRGTRTEPLRTRLRITRGGKTWTQETNWKFRTYNAAELKRLLRRAPSLELLACYDFTYDIEEPRKFDDSYADIILVLRRK